MKRFIKDFGKRFKIENMGTPTRFLGMKIERTKDTLRLKQSSYISKAGDKFLSGGSSHTFPSPVAPSKLKEFTEITVAETDIERATMSSKPYLPLMGTLLWASLTHPEASYYVSYLCQYMHDPSLAAYEAGLNVLAY